MPPGLEDAHQTVLYGPAHYALLAYAADQCVHMLALLLGAAAYHAGLSRLELGCPPV